MSILISTLLSTTIAILLILSLKILEKTLNTTISKNYIWIFILPAIYAFVAVIVPPLKNYLGL